MKTIQQKPDSDMLYRNRIGGHFFQAWKERRDDTVVVQASVRFHMLSLRLKNAEGQMLTMPCEFASKVVESAPLPADTQPDRLTAIGVKFCQALEGYVHEVQEQQKRALERAAPKSPESDQQLAMVM